MSKELMYVLIIRMTANLNNLIVAEDYNLMNSDVLHYSMRLDRVLTHYNKALEKNRLFSCYSNQIKESWAV